MLIPYNTDAPLYYPPIATVGTIIVNVLLFIPVFFHEDPYGMYEEYGVEEVDWNEEGGEGFNPDDAEPASDMSDMEDVNASMLTQRSFRSFRQLQKLAEQLPDEEQPADSGKRSGPPIWRLLTLEFGKFRPWQWLTANYMHADIFHLLGNMFVLWGFGLVVEGKVGWWKFLAIYNLIGVVGWGFVQFTMLLADEGIGLGASLAIFGILVVALVWAPSNEMQCVFFFGFRPIIFEASIMAIAIFAVFLQLGLSALQILITMNGFGMGLMITSEILHLIGGGLGLAVGVAMVKKNWVDCENWDMFSVWEGKNIKTREEDLQDVSEQLEKIKKQEHKKLTASEATTAHIPANQQDVLLNQFRSLVAAGRPVDAWAIFCRGQQQCLGWHVPEPDFISYISQLRKQQLWDHAVGAMQEYLQRYSERETSVRLALAQVLIQHMNKPREAWQVLGEINGALLPANEKAPYDKLRAACKQKLTAGKSQGTKGT